MNDADICRRRTQFSSRLAKLYEKLRRAKDVSDPRNDVHTEDDVQNLDARMPSKLFYFCLFNKNSCLT